MNNCCESACAPPETTDHAYRRVLYIVLVLNAVMFMVELIAGYIASSSALQADAIDFLGDALNYVSALYVLDKSMRWKSVAALVKGCVIGLFGLLLLANTVYHWMNGILPKAETMETVGLLSLVVNMSCAALLFRFRKGDSNRSSVWICSRNDAVANVLVIIAGVIVYYTKSQWPDLLVSFIIVGLALSGAFHIIRRARGELR